MARRALLTAAALAGAFWLGCSGGGGAAQADPAGRETPVWSYEVRAEHPHDPDAFTQGLALSGGILVESTGLYGRSSLRLVEPDTGRVVRRVELPDDLFGEGAAVVGDRIVMLTWRAGRGFVYRRNDLTYLDSFSYRGEGWGLAWDGRRLIMSDGSSELRFLDPEDYTEIGRLEVADGGVPVDGLNELEYAEGLIWANVWRTDRAAVIDPETGRVEAWLDLSGLLTAQESAAADVLNGLAYDRATGRMYATGKLWPKLFFLEVVRP